MTFQLKLGPFVNLLPLPYKGAGKQLFSSSLGAQNSRMHRVSPQTHYDSDIPLPPFPSCNLFVVLHCLFPPPLHFSSQQITSKRFLVEARILLQCVNHSLLVSRMGLRGNGSMTSSIFNRRIFNYEEAINKTPKKMSVSHDVCFLKYKKNPAGKKES